MQDQHSDDSDHEEHIDERWLVSYADMMTLLFGLFVMLFSIASENTGKFNEQLREVSGLKLSETEVQQMTSSSVASAPTPTPSPTPAPVQAAVLINEDLRKQVEDLLKEKNETAVKIAKIEELEKQITETKVLTDSIKAEKEKKEKELEVARKETEELRVKVASAKKQEKQLKTPKPEPTPVDVEAIRRSIASESQKEVTKLKSELADMKATLKAQEKDAKVTAKETAKDANKEKELEQKLATLEQKEKQLQLDKQKIEQDLTKKNEELKEKIAELEKNEPTSRRFMMVVLKWSSEKHDLDLSVTDPAGKTYNFKKRKYGGHPGEFTLDSRSGPGAEIWQTEQIIPGVYTISWKLYNPYGNTSDVVYSGVVSSNAGKIDIREKRMPAAVGSQSSMRVKVDAEGKLTRM